MRVFPTAEDELAGRQIKPGRPNPLAIQFEREQKMITASIQLPILQDGSRRKDAGNAALDQLSRRRWFELITQGHLVPQLQKFGQITFRGMRRNSGHRHVVTLGQGNPKKGRSLSASLSNIS